MMAQIVIYRNMKQYGVNYPEGPRNFSVLSLDIRSSDGHIADGCLIPVLLEKAKDTDRWWVESELKGELFRLSNMHTTTTASNGKSNSIMST